MKILRRFIFLVIFSTLVVFFSNCSGPNTSQGNLGATYGATNLEANQAINDIVTALNASGVCKSSFASYASAINTQSSVTLPTLNLAGGPTLNAGGTLSQYGLVVNQVMLQSITNMTPLNGSGTARKGTLVFNSTTSSTQQTTTNTVSDMAFYYSSSGTLTSCEVRQFVLIPNLVTLGQQLESANVPPAQLELYQAIAGNASQILNNQTCNPTNGYSYPPFNQCVPATANDGWPVMDEVYQLGLVYLLNRFHVQANSVLATSNDYKDRVIGDLLAITNPTGTASATASGFNYSNWLATASGTPLPSPTPVPDQQLQAAQIGLGVAVGLDWFRYDLSKTQKSQIITTIQNNMLSVFTQSYQYYSGTSTNSICANPNPAAQCWWINSASNWNLDINGSLLVTLKVLSYEVDPVQDPALASQMQTLFNEITVAAKSGDQSSLSYGITSINPATGDGAWFEGLNYYLYASENFASLLTTYSDSTLNLPSNIQTGLANSLNFSQALRDPTGMPFGYSDNPYNFVETHSANFLYASLLNNPAATNYEAKMLYLALTQTTGNVVFLQERDYELALDLVWMNGNHLTQTAGSPVPTAVAFTTTNVGAVTDTTSGSNIYMAFKGEIPQQIPSGGYEAWYDTHQHNGDAGSFVFNSDGVRWAQIFGPDNYSAPTYDGNDVYDLGWIYFQQRTDGNNGISVTGEYAIDQIASPLTEVTNNSNEVVMSVNLTNTNKSAGLPTNLNTPTSGVTPGPFASALNSGSMIRTFTVGLTSGQGYAMIEDDIHAQANCSTSSNCPSLTWNMNLPITATVVSNTSGSTPTVVLSSPNASHGTSRLTLMAVVNNGTIGSWTLYTPPVLTTTEGPFWNFGQSFSISLFQGLQNLPTGTQILQLNLAPAYNTSVTKLQVYLVPGSSSYAP